MSDKNKTIYTPEEEQLIQQGLEYRQKMLAQAFSEGTPKRGSDMRIVNEILNSIDSVVNNSANTRLKQKDVENQTQVKASIVAILTEAAERRAKNVRANVEQPVVLDDTNIEKPTFVPGEMSTELEDIELKDILGEDSDVN